MGLGNWVKQRAKTDAAAAESESGSAPVQSSRAVHATSSGEMAKTVDACERTSSRWVGFVDRVTLTAIEGWAYDTHNPGTHVSVEAVTSKGKRVVTAAHLYRKDVEEAGHGDGVCGFFLDLSKLALTDESAIVRFVESKHPISVAPIEFDPARAVLTTEMPSGFFALMELCAAETRQAADALDLPR